MTPVWSGWDKHLYGEGGSHQFRAPLIKIICHSYRRHTDSCRGLPWQHTGHHSLSKQYSQYCKWWRGWKHCPGLDACREYDAGFIKAKSWSLSSSSSYLFLYAIYLPNILIQISYNAVYYCLICHACILCCSFFPVKLHFAAMRFSLFESLSCTELHLCVSVYRGMLICLFLAKIST